MYQGSLAIYNVLAGNFPMNDMIIFQVEKEIKIFIIHVYMYRVPIAILLWSWLIFSYVSIMYMWVHD